MEYTKIIDTARTYKYKITYKRGINKNTKDTVYKYNIYNNDISFLLVVNITKNIFFMVDENINQIPNNKIVEYLQVYSKNY